MAMSIRMATPEDAATLLSIYAPLVRETAITFELQPPTVDAFRHRIRDTLARHPWLVCEHHGDLIGYAYAASHRARAAYPRYAPKSFKSRHKWLGRGFQDP